MLASLEIITLLNIKLETSVESAITCGIVITVFKCIIVIKMHCT